MHTRFLDRQQASEAHVSDGLVVGVHRLHEVRRVEVHEHPDGARVVALQRRDAAAGAQVPAVRQVRDRVLRGIPYLSVAASRSDRCAVAFCWHCCRMAGQLCRKLVCWASHHAGPAHPICRQLWPGFIAAKYALAVPLRRASLLAMRVRDEDSSSLELRASTQRARSCTTDAGWSGAGGSRCKQTPPRPPARTRR